jgi:hypothetical protein
MSDCVLCKVENHVHPGDRGQILCSSYRLRAASLVVDVIGDTSSDWFDWADAFSNEFKVLLDTENYSA